MTATDKHPQSASPMGDLSVDIIAEAKKLISTNKIIIEYSK